MDPIVVQIYKPEYHAAVRRIFASGEKEQIKRSIILGWQNPKVIGFFTLFFIIGMLFSIICGILALLFGFCLHSGFVIFTYTFYVK